MGDGQSLFTFTKDLPGWFPDSSGGLLVVVPSLPLSQVVSDSSDDSVTAIMGSSREESITPLEVVMIVPPVGDVRPVSMDAELLEDSPLPTAEGLLADLLWAPVAPRPSGISECGDPCSLDQVPRWRLAREGPFLAALSLFGAGCAFRNTSYRASNYASPSGDFGIPLHHLRFLEWIGVLQSASLLEMGIPVMTGPPAPVMAGPLAPATSVTFRNRVPVMTGPLAPVTAGPPAPATSVTDRNRVPVTAGPLTPATSVTARNRVPATTGPPAPVTAGPLAPATSATATGFSVSVGYAAQTVAILISIMS